MHEIKNRLLYIIIILYL